MCQLAPFKRGAEHAPNEPFHIIQVSLVDAVEIKMVSVCILSNPVTNMCFGQSTYP